MSRGRLVITPAVGGMNSGAKLLAKMSKVSDIKIHPEIASIFVRDESMIETIKESIIKNGYDISQPIVLWEEEGWCVDGHTRLEASVRANEEEVPIIEKSFSSLYEAKLYCYKRQAERRNLSQAEILEASITLDTKQTRDGQGRSSEILAKELGVSASTIQHARAVGIKGSEDLIEKVRKGQMTINEAYKTVKQPKKQQENGFSKDKPEQNDATPEKPSSISIPSLADDLEPETVTTEEVTHQPSTVSDEYLRCVVETLCFLCSKDCEKTARVLFDNLYNKTFSQNTIQSAATPEQQDILNELFYGKDEVLPKNYWDTKEGAV